MKVTLVLLAVLARHAVAQDTNASMLTMLGFPACSVDCITQGNTQSGCQLTDIKCQCTVSTKSIIAQCFADGKSTCTPADIQTTQDVGEQLCATSGFPLPGTNGTSSVTGSAGGAATTSAPAVLTTSAPPSTTSKSKTKSQTSSTAPPATAAPPAPKSAAARAGGVAVGLLGLVGVAAGLML